MRLQQFYYLVEVAKAKSISKAAKNLFISQPSLSVAISNLEEELNTRIFFRSQKGVEPTGMGQLIIDKASQIVQTAEEIKGICGNTSITGHLTISTLPAVCNSIIFEVYTLYIKNHPYVEVVIKEDDNANILQEIENGTIDIGIIGLFEHEKQDFLALVQRNNYQYEELFYDEVCIYVGENNPLAKKKLVYVDEILNYPAITYKNNISDRDIIAFEKLTKLKTFLRLTDRENIKKIVAQGTALAFLPRIMSLNDIYVRSGHITPLNIIDLKMPLAIVMVLTKKNYLSAMEQKFISILKSFVNKFISDSFS